MKKFLIAAMILGIATPAISQVNVKGYMKKDGTYVAPHVRTKPNSSTNDNYSTKGNYNPNTGQQGTKSPDNTYKSPYRPYKPK